MEIRQKFSNERYAMDFESAPLSVRAGKVLLWIGSILFFIASFFDLVFFTLSLIIPEVRSSFDFQDPGQMFQFVNLPVLAVLFIFAGIGGIAYLKDAGKAKRLCTLSAIILLFVVVIDTVVSIRNLVYGIINPDVSAADAWGKFFLSLLDVQLSGGLYLLGWILMKDYMGDKCIEESK